MRDMQRLKHSLCIGAEGEGTALPYGPKKMGGICPALTMGLLIDE
jgi:hypothetical protein